MVLDVLNAVPHDVVRIIIGMGSSGIAYSMLAGFNFREEMQKSPHEVGGERTWREKKSKGGGEGKLVIGASSVCIGLASSLTALLVPEEYFYPTAVSLAAFLSAAGDIVIRRKK